MRKAFVCSLLIASLPALAGVYRWTDDKGVVHYADSPPTPSAKPAELPALQTFDSKALTKGSPVGGSAGTSPDNTATPPAAVAPPSARPVITSPANGTTLRDDSGQITVSVTVPEGSSLIYYLDGAAQNASPTPSTSFLIENVERGPHSLEVAIADSSGKEMARSEKVTVYYMPPTASMGKKKKG
jgi:hypothetical protein